MISTGSPIADAFIGGAGIGLMITILAWAKVRVIFFRQDLFAIRDELWIIARDKGALKDQGYLAARERLNNLISGAAILNYPIYVLVRRHLTKDSGMRHRVDESPIADEIRDALSKTQARLNRYLHGDQPVMGLAGNLLRFWLWVRGKQLLSSQEWLCSNGPRSVADLAEGEAVRLTYR